MNFINTRRIGMPGLIYLTFCSVVVVVNRHSVMKKTQENNFPSRVFQAHTSRGRLQSCCTKIWWFGFPELLTNVVSASSLIGRMRSIHTAHARGLNRGAHSRCLGCMKSLAGSSKPRFLNHPLKQPVLTSEGPSDHWATIFPIYMQSLTDKV